MTVRTRFAPSPTGFMHVGGVRTALFNYLFARHSGGSFILRSEDTDRTRSTVEFEKALMEDLRWLDLNWNEGPDIGGDFAPYRQSERLPMYLEYAKRLLKENKAYYCYCTKLRLEGLRKSRIERHLPPRYDGRCRELKDIPDGIIPVIRFKMPKAKVEFTDMVHGRISFDGADIGDFIIVDCDNRATYNFAVVIDDALMKITHVIRGEDHLPNTPRQIAMFKALGFNVPYYLHLPLVVDRDGMPLSKRNEGMSVRRLKEDGFLPTAILNAVAHLGWTPPQENMSLNEMASLFTAERLSRSPSVFTIESLKRYNKQAIAKTEAESLYNLISPYFKGVEKTKLRCAIELVKKNAATTNEIIAMISPFFKEFTIKEDALGMIKEPEAKYLLERLLKEIENTETLDWGAIVNKLKCAGKRGKTLFLPIRIALSGSAVGIEIENIVKILGKEKTLERLKTVLGKI